MRPDEAKAAVVAEIFAAYLEPGASLFGVSRHLREMSVPAPRGEGVEHGHPARDTDQPRLRGQGLRRACTLPPRQDPALVHLSHRAPHDSAVALPAE